MGITDVLALLGGLALFLYGMQMMSTRMTLLHKRRKGYHGGRNGGIGQAFFHPDHVLSLIHI